MAWITNCLLTVVLCLASSNAQEISMTSSVRDSRRNLSCENERVVYTCNTTGSILAWIVDPYVPELNAVTFFSSDPLGTAVVIPLQAVRILVETSPTLFSELTLSPTDGLRNATIICRTDNGVSAEDNYMSSVPPQPPTNVSISAVDGVRNIEGLLTASVNWTAPSDLDISHYILRVYLDNVLNLVTIVVNGTSHVYSVRDTTDAIEIRAEVVSVNECGEESGIGRSDTRNVNDLRNEENLPRLIGVGSAGLLVVIFCPSVFAGVVVWVSIKRWKRTRSKKDVYIKKFPQKTSPDSKNESEDLMPLIEVEVFKTSSIDEFELSVTYNEDGIRRAAKDKPPKQNSRIVPAIQGNNLPYELPYELPIPVEETTT